MYTCTNVHVYIATERSAAERHTFDLGVVGSILGGDRKSRNFYGFLSPSCAVSLLLQCFCVPGPCVVCHQVFETSLWYVYQVIGSGTHLPVYPMKTRNN